ncbi:MAG TPA: NERD domain-containing protein [Geobacteraceae bacterium]|nr:NERD domain-containing protein [Geobacteraceae bacterium]
MICFSLIRLGLILLVSLSVATYLNYDSYKDFYGKKLFKLHTADLKTLANQMTIKLDFFLDQGNSAAIQNVLDASFGLFGFVITDCVKPQRNCPEQRILYTSDPGLPWLHKPSIEDLQGGSFALLQRPRPVGNMQASPERPPGQIIGRLYVIKNIPSSFREDYLSWLASPFSDAGMRRFYLRTSFAFVAGALIIWTVTEFYFMVRRRQRRSLLRREEELRTSVDSYLKQLTEKNSQITRLNDQSRRQYELYVGKIRSLEQKIRNEEEYRELAEQIIHELESAQSEQSSSYIAELEMTKEEIRQLQEKIEQFEKSSSSGRESSYKALEEAVRTRQFSNVFEQKIYEIIAASRQYQRGEWRLMHNFDVAPGRNYRQFTDFILVNSDALVIIEAKYYVGTIESPGDFLNDIWISNSSQRKKIDCLWGENPYHQINEYSMSLMKVLKQRSPWNFQIFAIIVFPDEADISKIGEHLGKFYRVTTLGRLLPLLDGIFGEARRFQASKNPQRPKPEQVEEMLRGRKISL